MQRPSWAPIVLSGVLPKEFSDLLAISVLFIATIQAVLYEPFALASVGPSWILLLLVPVTCTLASLSNSRRREREELALFAYGGSPAQIAVRYVIRGGLIVAIGLLPLFVRFLVSGLAYSIDFVMLTVLAIIGGTFYAAPAVRRTHSTGFVGNYKG